MDEIEGAFNSAGREAMEAFGRAECYVEKFLTHPRHVEAQVLADTHGNVRVLGTRDCSTQRRFQKLIEEAPAPALSDAQRTGIIEGARSICSHVGYTGAGTVEYIVSEDGTISFLEVNTRVQVEHPVTEVVTGTDIIAEQFRIAAGEPLSIAEDPASTGHAFEFRINAEDILNGFAPCPGTIVSFEPPTGPGIRVDSAVRSGSIIPPYYDSLIAKLIVWGPTREVALARSRQALREFDVSGVRTVLPFHRDMMDEPALIGTASSAEADAGASDIGVFTDWLDHNYRPSAANQVDKVEAIYTKRRTVAVEIDGKLVNIGVPMDFLAGAGAGAGAGAADGSGATAPSTAGAQSTDDSAVTSPFEANLVAWNVSDGDSVSEGDSIATVEAMKMESAIKAPRGGTIKILAEEGDRLDSATVIATID
jgi:acyl-coA carboxylase, alpha subunit